MGIESSYARHIVASSAGEFSSGRHRSRMTGGFLDAIKAFRDATAEYSNFDDVLRLRQTGMDEIDELLEKGSLDARQRELEAMVPSH